MAYRRPLQQPNSHCQGRQELHWPNCAPVTAKYLVSTWIESTRLRATIAIAVVSRLMTHITTSTALRSRPHWQWNHYVLRRQKPRNTSTRRLMKRANYNNNMSVVAAVNWDMRVAYSACREEELRLLSCCPYIMEWTTTNIRCTQDDQLVNLHKMQSNGKRLFVLASCCPSTNKFFNGALLRNDHQVKLFEILLDSNILVPECQFFKAAPNSRVYAVCREVDCSDDACDCRTMNSKVVYIVGMKVKKMRHQGEVTCTHPS